MTGQFESQGATAGGIDLGSFPPAGVAIVFGANGGIGGALVEAIRAAERFEHVIAFSRRTSPSIDLLDEASLERASAFAAHRGELRLVINATGLLHDNRQGPEKSGSNLMLSSSLDPLRYACDGGRKRFPPPHLTLRYQTRTGAKHRLAG